jgi:hypothetical protein
MLKAALTQAPAGLLFFSFLYREDFLAESQLLSLAQDLYGEGSLLHTSFNPLFSYYSKEMGEEARLKRFFFVPHQSFPREFLLSTKLIAMTWEHSHSEQNIRKVNVDVGMISLENFILATTKNYSHRIFLGQNIFADLTYQFNAHKFHYLPWTYPDYQDPQKVEFITDCRKHLLMRGK